VFDALSLKKNRYFPPYNVAQLFARVGQTEAALQWLEQTFSDRDVHMNFLLDHKWDGIRSTQKFSGASVARGISNS
jgi:hypothetical protein